MLNIFPLIVKKTIHFQYNLGDKHKHEVENLIVAEYKKRKIDEFETNESGIRFRNSLFFGQNRFGFFAPVDEGIIQCLATHAILTFSTKRMALFALVISLLIGVGSYSVFIGLVAFGGFYGVNFLIFWARTWLFINQLKKEIDRKVLVNVRNTSQNFVTMSEEQ